MHARDDCCLQVFMLRRQLREAEVRSVPSMRERPLRGMPSGGPKFNGQGSFGMGPLPGPPGGGPSPHGHRLGKFEMSPDNDRKRHMRESNMDAYGGGKRMR